MIEIRPQRTGQGPGGLAPLPHRLGESPPSIRCRPAPCGPPLRVAPSANYVDVLQSHSQSSVVTFPCFDTVIAGKVILCPAVRTERLERSCFPCQSLPACAVAALRRRPHCSPCPCRTIVGRSAVRTGCVIVGTLSGEYRPAVRAHAVEPSHTPMLSSALPPHRRFRGRECRETDCPPGEREGNLHRVIVGRSLGRVMPLDSARQERDIRHEQGIHFPSCVTARFCLDQSPVSVGTGCGTSGPPTAPRLSLSRRLKCRTVRRPLSSATVLAAAM